MAAPSNTFTTLVAKGNREDLENVIYRVDPEATPFTSNIDKVKVKNTFHEWQIEELEPVSPSVQPVEGDEITSYGPVVNTNRVGNIAQIFQKTGLVAATQEAVDRAGVDSDFEHQKVLKGLAMKRDIEARMIGNYASNVQSGGTGRGTAGALAWITTNISRNTGANGGYANGIVSAATNGTTRAFTETQLKTVMASAFSKGGVPTQAYMGPAHKQAASAFTGIAQQRHEVGGKGKVSIIGAADIYVSDFGDLAFIPHAYGLTRDVLLIDPSKWAVGTLRAMDTVDLAKTGDNMKFLMTA